MRNTWYIRAIYFTVFLLTVSVLVLLILLLQSKTEIFLTAIKPSTPAAERSAPFPVSVDRYTKTIAPDPQFDIFYSDSLASTNKKPDQLHDKILAKLTKLEWYQNLGSPVSRIFVIWPGQRKEEISKDIGDVLGWKQNDREEFIMLMDKTYPIMTEGKYLPGRYVGHRNATPREIQNVLTENFKTEILARYTPNVAAKVPLEEAIIIASLLEREASDFENMRQISGVIWNRLFIDMPLQLDATLQYVRGGRTYEPNWWPVVRPADKYLDSPYNTYKYRGLPPAPIANPSIESIVAALNPVETDCLFYFHTDAGPNGYHCSVTYEEHVSKLRSIYGRGL
jgi:cell division protein YceG involved in septum cleavage